MIETEKVWRCPFNSLPTILQVKFLIEENAYFRWEQRMCGCIPGTPKDDWYWAEDYVEFNWPFLVIKSLSPNLTAQESAAQTKREDWGDQYDYSPPE